MAINIDDVRRFEAACIQESAKAADRETARMAYICMLRDVARALESDPAAFHGAALQVRDTSAVVVDAFQGQAGMLPYTVITVLDGDDMEAAVDHVMAPSPSVAVTNACRDGWTAAVLAGHHNHVFMVQP